MRADKIGYEGFKVVLESNVNKSGRTSTILEYVYKVRILDRLLAARGKGKVGKVPACEARWGRQEVAGGLRLLVLASLLCATPLQTELSTPLAKHHTKLSTHR